MLLQHQAPDKPRVAECQFWPMMLPPETPAAWAAPISKALRTPAASSAIASTETVVRHGDPSRTRPGVA